MGQEKWRVVLGEEIVGGGGGVVIKVKGSSHLRQSIAE